MPEHPTVPAMLTQLESAYQRLLIERPTAAADAQRLISVLDDFQWYSERLGLDRWYHAPRPGRWSFAENLWHVTKQTLAESSEPLRYFIDHGKEHVGQAAELLAIFAYDEGREAESALQPESDPNALDSGQYTLDSIRKYEAVYGRNFISPGGLATTQAILSLIDFAPDMRVLDVGCGLGGAALLMAQTFGAQVLGIDLSQNMLQIAQARCRQAQLTHAVTFEQADILQFDSPAAYDLVHSRDAFLHIHEKARLFAILRRCLRPGGRVLFTDYLCSAEPHSDEFAAYVRARNYDLHTLDAYRALLTEAGFALIEAEDRTADFISILELELARLPECDLPEAERAELTHSWQAKLDRARAGEQRWGVFVGKLKDES